MRARGSVESVHRALIQETLVQGFDAGRPLGVATIAHDHFDAVLKAGRGVPCEPEGCTAIEVTRHEHRWDLGVYFPVARGSDRVRPQLTRCLLLPQTPVR